MVKEETWLHHIRHGGFLGTGNAESRDYEILWSRNQGLNGHPEGAYSIPEHTLGSAYDERTKGILRAIKHAAGACEAPSVHDGQKDLEDLRHELLRRSAAAKGRIALGHGH